MTIDSIERILENGKTLGVQMKTESDMIGWYLIFKRFGINSFFEKFIEMAEEHIKMEQIDIMNNPYMVLERKVNKDFFFANDDINDNSDYLVSTDYTFRDLGQALDFFLARGYSLKDFVWLVDLQYMD
jgi:hypothetical protein